MYLQEHGSAFPPDVFQPDELPSEDTIGAWRTGGGLGWGGELGGAGAGWGGAGRGSSLQIPKQPGRGGETAWAGASAACGRPGDDQGAGCCAFKPHAHPAHDSLIALPPHLFPGSTEALLRALDREQERRARAREAQVATGTARIDFSKGAGPLGHIPASNSASNLLMAQQAAAVAAAAVARVVGKR